MRAGAGTPRLPDRRRIAQDLHDGNGSSEYTPRAKLPSFRELITRYGMSAEPVRSALLS
ncbi:GntR family transcriptional regulator [Micromonospora sp. NPDC050397]|uniref:GntR family transcriptional regulator n=1 Tax=Micromonospora sp. NPDC050397 TaxID=3364279 RepID=UPI00384B0B50